MDAEQLVHILRQPELILCVKMLALEVEKLSKQVDPSIVHEARFLVERIEANTKRYIDKSINPEVKS